MGSNNTNKWDAQEPMVFNDFAFPGSNNTNKWDAQELNCFCLSQKQRSNNTNKWDAQEHTYPRLPYQSDQIIPINGMLKNGIGDVIKSIGDQIIPINGMLKNLNPLPTSSGVGSNNTNKWDAQERGQVIEYTAKDQIIPINGMLKNTQIKPVKKLWIK